MSELQQTANQTPTARDPFGDVGCKCGRGPHAVLPGKCAAGHPLKGFPGDALVTSEHSAWFRTAAAGLQREIAAAVLRDKGHKEADAPEALRRVADGIAQAVLIRDSAFARVAEAGGPMTSSDRARRAFVVWAKSSQTVERLARVIGLDRVPAKSVPTLAEALRGE